MRFALAGLALLFLSTAAQAELFELTGYRLYVPATVNEAPVTALLDSGAEMTVLDDDFAKRLGLMLEGKSVIKGSGGSQAARFARDVSVSAAGVVLPAGPAVVIDLDGISRLAGRPVNVIVGREFFDSGRIRIDFGSGEVTSIARDEAPAGEMFPLTTGKGIETFPVSVEGQPPVQADFDLGNGSEVLVGRAYAERIGLAAPDRVIGRKSGGGIGGTIDRDVVVLKTLRIGRVIFDNVVATIDPTPNAADLNIGTRILRHFRLTIDYPQRALWLEFPQ